MKTEAIALTLLLSLCAASGCRHSSPGAKGWIAGSSDERWATMERHLRGLDVAMVEVGYRYQELYWAGADENWSFADYQLTKIELALANALQRRPKRRPSSEALFLPSLDAMKLVVGAREERDFEEAFAGLTAACNSCHVAEGVPSFRVEIPSDRPSPIRGRGWPSTPSVSGNTPSEGTRE